MKVVLTKRLVLEPLAAHHADLLFAGLADDRLHEFVNVPQSADIASLRERFVRWESRLSPDKSERWLNWAVKRREDGAYIGYVQATVDGTGNAWLGYVLFVPAWGHGFAREAVRALIKSLPRLYGVTLFAAVVNTRNSRSIRLLRALGFCESSRASEPIGACDVIFEKAL